MINLKKYRMNEKSTSEGASIKMRVQLDLDDDSYTKESIIKSVLKYVKPAIENMAKITNVELLENGFDIDAYSISSDLVSTNEISKIIEEQVNKVFDEMSVGYHMGNYEVSVEVQSSTTIKRNA